MPTRNEVVAWNKSSIAVDLCDKKSDLAQGWAISAHHRMNPSSPDTLHKGDGTVIRSMSRSITTLAGNGQTGWFEDGAAAVATPVSRPTAAALNEKWELFIANQVYPGIIKVDKDGIVEVGLRGMIYVRRRYIAPTPYVRLLPL